MGPSGTGKTSALLIPTLRSWQSRGHPHHLLARSPVCKFTFENRKTPNISRTVRFRGDFGRFYLIWLYGGGEARYLLLWGNRKAPHRCGAFALPGRWSKGTVQLSVVLFLAGNNGCTNGCTTADKHKDNQQSRVACVAGLRNSVLRCGSCGRSRGSRSRGGLVVVLRPLRNISVLSIGEGYCYGIVIYDAATCFRRRRGVAVLICFSLSY